MSPAPSNQGHWIELSDFSPGIHEDWSAAGGGGMSMLKNGAATKTNTYRCYADPMTGALSPLPKRVAGETQTLLPAGNANGTTGFYPANHIAAYLLDALVMGPIRDNTVDNFNDPAVVPDEPFLLYGFWYNSAGTGSVYSYFTLGRFWKLWDASLTIDFFFGMSSNSQLSGFNIGSGSMDKSRTIQDGALDPPSPSDLQPYVMFLAESVRSSHKTGTLAAAGVTGLTTFDTDINYGGTASFVSGSFANVCTFPDATGAGSSSNTVGDPILDQFAKMVVGHQGRLLAICSGPATFGNDAIHSHEYIDYTFADFVTQADSLLFVGEENPSFYATVATLTANELLLIKSHGGAILINGDLNEPDVHRLPLVESAGPRMHRSVQTPLGLVYGNRYGVYAWAGGDTSTYLSPQLAGFFWQHELDPTNEVYNGQCARFSYWSPFVCVPNNWLMDTRSGAWWRLDPPSTSLIPYNAYDISAGTGRMYAFHYKITAAWNVAWSTYDWSLLAADWSWQSQPLYETRDTMMAFQKIEIVCQRPTNASGTCTITATLTGVDYNGATVTSRDVLFDLSTMTADRPAVLQAEVRDANGGNFTARYVQVRFVATSSAGTAPKLYPNVRIWARDGKSTVGNA